MEVYHKVFKVLNQWKMASSSGNENCTPSDTSISTVGSEDSAGLVVLEDSIVMQIMQNSANPLPIRHDASICSLAWYLRCFVLKWNLELHMLKIWFFNSCLLHIVSPFFLPNVLFQKLLKRWNVKEVRISINIQPNFEIPEERANRISFRYTFAFHDAQLNVVFDVSEVSCRSSVVPLSADSHSLQSVIKGGKSGSYISFNVALPADTWSSSKQVKWPYVLYALSP